MSSQKNNDLKYCIKCKILLTSENWLNYLIKRSNYICTPCYRQYGKTYPKTDPEYNQKQNSRHKQRRSAVICAYGNQCAYCYEDDYNQLTIDHIHNNGAQHRKEINNIIDHLYNNKIDKDNYQILCWNCNCSKNITYKDKYALRDKIKVLEQYGLNCLLCKEDRIERLTIDHSNNDGAEQRAKLNCYTGIRFYRWLIKNNYPQNLGLRVLCYNCNCGFNT